MDTNIHIRPPNSSSPFVSSSAAFHYNNPHQITSKSSLQSAPELSAISSTTTTLTATTTTTNTTMATTTATTTATSTTTSNGRPIILPLTTSINQNTNRSTSLFQICSTLKDRLESIPGLGIYVEACYYTTNENRNSSSSNNSLVLIGPSPISPSASASTSSLSMIPNSGKLVDPVTFIWRFVRLGSSLCALFNILDPNTMLKANLAEDVKGSKRAVYDFVQGCKSELGYTDDELFTISNVFSDNTGDLLKVSLFFSAEKKNLSYQ